MSEMKSLESAILSGKDVSIPDSIREWLSQEKKHFVGGKFVSSQARQSFNSINPASEDQVASICLGEKADIDLAVAAAKKAFDEGDWARTPLEKRTAVLEQISREILNHRPALALLESLDTGKPIAESFDGDIPRAAKNFQFFAEYARAEGAPCYPHNEALHYAVREPIGVVALITPWNLPLYLETWKLAPCLAMGNSCVLKPSELTPLTASYLAEFVISKLDIPPGVFNLVHGFGDNGAGEALVSHADVEAISFTGETRTGRAIMKAASVGPTRLSFELGGKGATIVFEDADIEKALEVSLRAAFRNQGEICLACPRIYVAESKFSEFVDAFTKRAKEIRVGNPLNYGTQMGALIGKEHFEKVSGYVQSVKAPAEILCGGKRDSTGYYFEPTVIVGLNGSDPISNEEIFGPVVSIYPFSEESEVLEAVNATPYGLSASVWTSNLDRAHRVAKGLRSGLVWVNSWFLRDLRVPFGGQKRSGVGREGGTHSLDFFSEWKSVGIQFQPQ